MHCIEKWATPSPLHIGPRGPNGTRDPIGSWVHLDQSLAVHYYNKVLITIMYLRSIYYYNRVLSVLNTLIILNVILKVIKEKQTFVMFNRLSEIKEFK